MQNQPTTPDTFEQLKQDILVEQPDAVRDAVNAAADEFWDAATRFYQLVIQQDDPYFAIRHLATVALATKEAEQTGRHEVQERKRERNFHVSFRADATDQAAAIWDALACGRKSCGCIRGPNTHCPSHHDEKPSLTVTVKAGKLLINCKTGCSQAAVISSLQRMGLWRRPPGGI